MCVNFKMPKKSCCVDSREVSTRKHHRCNQCPNEYSKTRPAGSHFDPHCGHIARQCREIGTFRAGNEKIVKIVKTFYILNSKTTRLSHIQCYIVIIHCINNDNVID